jgi:hypothetical protein
MACSPGAQPASGFELVHHVWFLTARDCPALPAAVPCLRRATMQFNRHAFLWRLEDRMLLPHQMDRMRLSRFGTLIAGKALQWCFHHLQTTAAANNKPE